MKILLVFLFSVACTGIGDSNFEGPVLTNGSTNQTSNNSTTANSNNVVSNDMGTTTNSDDAGANQDTGPDIADPVFLNACDSGPLALPIANCQPAPLPSTGDDREDCVRRVNQFRWECQCLPPLQRWTAGEACADQQAAHDAQTNSPHNGFSSGICSPRGNAQNECPSWNSWDRVVSGCLQQMWDEGPGEPFSAHGHYINMSSNRYTMVACGEGGGWFVQNFK